MALPLSAYHFATLDASLIPITTKWISALDTLSPATKSSFRRWQTGFARELLQEALVETVAEWFSRCLSCNARLLGAEDVAYHFAEAQWLHHTAQEYDWRRLFREMQTAISTYMFGQNEPNQVQHNLMEYMTGQVDDDLEDANDEEQPGSATDCSVQQLMNWSDFDDIIKPKMWITALINNPHLWDQLCASWSARLSDAYRNRESIEPDEGDQFYSSVVDVLREIRRVPKAVYRKCEWLDSVQKSSLPSAILTWSHPDALALWRSPFTERLLRFHRINFTLFFVLTAWVPTSYTLTEEKPSVTGLAAEVKASKVLNNGRAVFKFLKNHPEVIPLKSSPTSAYCLVGLVNFVDAWNDWMRCAAQALGYDTSRLYDRDGKFKSEQVYREVREALSERAKRGLDQIDNVLFRVIVQRSWQFRNLKNQLAPKGGGILGRADTSNATAPCHRCISLNVTQRCVQDIRVTAAGPDPALVGCGISQYGLPEVLDLSKVESQGTPPRKPLLHPQRDLDLQVYRCDENIVRRCGKQIFRLVDENTGELRDFWVYNAFDPTAYNTLRRNVQRFGKLKSLVRGQQFATFSQGRMCPFGERTASGGAPGDTHRFYDVMSGQTEDALHCLFDHAEDSLTLVQTTRLVAPEIYELYRVATRDGEKVGLDASTLYYCNNYTAPLHIDDDATPGICAMLEFDGGPDDYCFVNLAYGIRFLPRANSLWSFRGTDLHGTMLPSLALRLRGGKADTLHVTRPKRNARAASRFEAARLIRGSVERFWGSN